MTTCAPGSVGDNKSARKVRGRADNRARAIHKEVTCAPIYRLLPLFTPNEAQNPLAYIWHRKSSHRCFQLHTRAQFVALRLGARERALLFRMALADTRRKIG